jgi:hypothetical protein
MVRGAGEWPVHSALTSPVCFPMTLPCGEPSPVLLTTCSNHAYINLHAEPEMASGHRQCLCADPHAISGP